MQPNWFDKKFAPTMRQANATQALQQIATDPQIIQAVSDALAVNDASNTTAGWSRTQAIRSALVAILQAN